MTKKLFQEFSRTKSRFLAALSKLFLLNLQVQVQLGTGPDTSQNYKRKIQQCNEDRYQNDLHPEVGILVNRSSQAVNSDRDLLHYNRLWREVDIVVGAFENRVHDTIVTEIANMALLRVKLAVRSINVQDVDLVM